MGYEKQNYLKNARVDAEEIFKLAQFKVWAWVMYRFKKATFSLSDWILCPLICIKYIQQLVEEKSDGMLLIQICKT